MIVVQELERILPLPPFEVWVEDYLANRGEYHRYTDALQAMARVWLIVSQSYSLVWLPLVFPAIPVLFALGGAAVASGLDRYL